MPASRTWSAVRTTFRTRPSSCSCSRRCGASPPRYAHLPLLHGPDGRKLSKRHGAASVQELRDAGYLPEAVDNYIALLGAGFAPDEEHFSLSELAERFRLERVSKNPAVFDERKLRHMNGRHLRELGTDELTRRLERFTGRSGLRDAVEISAEKIQTLADFWPLVSFLFDGPVDDPAAFAKTIGGDGGIAGPRAGAQALADVEPFDAPSGSRRRCAASWSAAARSPGRCSSPCASRSRDRPSVPVSSRAWLCSDVTRRWLESTVLCSVPVATTAKDASTGLNRDRTFADRRAKWLGNYR